MNNTFRDCKSKVYITGLLGDFGTNKQHCKLSKIQLFSTLWRHRQCHIATLKNLRFLLKAHCRRHGWWYHVPHYSFTLCVCLFVCVCVFVCGWVSVYVSHDVCPDDLAMKYWCHRNNILQVHCWWCLVVQIMFHALMTSLMTSQDHKIGQILKLTYLRRYLS